MKTSLLFVRLATDLMFSIWACWKRIKKVENQYIEVHTCIIHVYTKYIHLYTYIYKVQTYKCNAHTYNIDVCTMYIHGLTVYKHIFYLWCLTRSVIRVSPQHNFADLVQDAVCLFEIPLGLLPGLIREVFL